MRPYSKSRIKSSFDKSAKSYEQYAQFQTEITNELANRIDQLALSGLKVMEFGSGVGQLTKRLIESGMFSQIVAFDIASQMAASTHKRCAGHDTVITLQADVDHIPLKDNSIELGVANLALQWIESHDALFKSIASVLKNGGGLMATALSEGTFAELREVVTEAMGAAGKRVEREMFHKFTNEKEIISSATKAGFEIRIEKKSYVKVYDDFYSFLKTLKKIGVQNSRGLSGLGLGRRQVMENMASIYSANHGVDGGVRVSYEVLFIEAFLIQKIKTD